MAVVRSRCRARQAWRPGVGLARPMQKMGESKRGSGATWSPLRNEMGASCTAMQGDMALMNVVLLWLVALA